MRILRRRGVWVVALAAAALLFARGAGPVRAVDACPAGVDACLFVNSDLDNDIRDGVLTLREALLVTGNHLTLTDLTLAERGQVIIMSPPGGGPPGDEPTFGGAGDLKTFAVYFDPTVFCPACHRTIVLSPPGFGGPGGIGGRALALPPVTDPDAARLPDGSPWAGTVGPGFVPGKGEVPVDVTIDGGTFGPAYAGLWAGSPGAALRGFTLQHFGGAAVEVSCAALAGVTVDVAFHDNATDVAVVGCE
jgi:hypothetical protein